MTKEELLAEAKRKYPVGTVFVSWDDDNRHRTVNLYPGEKEITWYWCQNPSLCIRNDNGMKTEGVFCSNPHVYKDGKWAEIISKPESKEFVLPEKWFINSSIKEERLLIAKWFDKNHGNSNGSTFYADSEKQDLFNANGFTNAYNRGNVYHTDCPKIAAEITFEQFKKYVLKEDTMESKFVVGKWYKNLGIDKDFIAPFRKMEGNDFSSNKNGTQEYIYKNKYETDNSIGITSYFKCAIECSLEEIQQYLPDGHPDKIVKKKHTFTNDYGFTLEEGEVYKIITNGEVAIARFIKENTHTTNIIWIEAYTFNTGGKINFKENAQKATPDEIAWLEACEKAGKYVNKPTEEAWIPKIDEWVVVEKRDNSNLKKGDVFQIFENPTPSEVYKGRYWIETIKGSTGYGILNTNLRKALPHEIPILTDAVQKHIKTLNNNQLTNKTEKQNDKSSKPIGNTINLQSTYSSIRKGTAREGSSTQGETQQKTIRSGSRCNARSIRG